MIKLFWAPGTCALAPHIVLEWIGEEYKNERVQLGGDAYKLINPAGSVPAMIDGETGVMTQADAILKYLADKYPETNLGPSKDLNSRYEMDRWLAYLTGDLHPAFFPFFGPKRFTTSKAKSATDEVIQASYQRIGEVLEILEAHITEPYILESRRTIVDPYAFSIVRWVNLLPSGLSPYPNLKRFHDAFITDTAVKDVLTTHGIKI